MPSLSRGDSCQDIDFTLRRQFGKTSFRPLQREIITAALARKDVFVQAATSFGKSLCFQLPACIDSGITIVISPLLSLMTDQVVELQNAGVKAHALNTNTTPAEQDFIHHDLGTGHPLTRLLYVSPEKCSTSRFRERLRLVHVQEQLARFAIDEAHCISEWGHDFRKTFKELSWLRETFPDVPIMALTATANEQVRVDVLSTLGLNKDPGRLETYTTTAFRPNLHLQIRFTNDEDGPDHRYDDFVTWLFNVWNRRREPERKAYLDSIGQRVESVPGIIYTTSRDQCDQLAAALRHEKIGARPYHAKLSKEVKDETLARWRRNEAGYDIIVATTAFGMGIDKPDVRFVVHWRMPKSFEGYYQEVGRAGRDGKASHCFMYYSREDRDRMCSMVTRDKDYGNRAARERSLRQLVDFCENTSSCRHAYITKYFGEKETPVCDNACDWHKEGAQGLKKRLKSGLADEEWISTQREEGAYDDYDFIE